MSFEFKPLDFSNVNTYSIKTRKSKVTYKDFAGLYKKGGSFASFIDGIPGILAGKQIDEIVKALVYAYNEKRCIVFSMGAHVIKVGLSPIIIDLMKRGLINAIALNGAGSIHDAEIAMAGETSEDVAGGLKDGSFGMADETGKLLNDAANIAAKTDRGFGEVIGDKLSGLPYEELSIIAQARKLGIPVTIHISIGSDIIHMHPEARGDFLGNASFNDFKLFCGIISRVTEGSVIVNIGSAVVLPTVIEKAIAVARNQGFPVTGFVGVNMDFNRHYRSNLNPVQRAKDLGGKGYYLIGHHELLVPLLAACIIEKVS